MADGLLEFASASGLSGPSTAVDLEAMVTRIAEESTEGTRMRFAIRGAWPVLTTAVAPLDIILRNLVRNAVQHHDTGSGAINIAANVVDDRLEISVADDGPGIPPDQHEVIFTPTVRCSEHGAATTGLGLAFVRRAASSVGGNVIVHSDPEQACGTTFTVQWPMRPD